MILTDKFFPSRPGQYNTQNECPRYDTKQSDGDVPVMLELWGIRSTPSLPFLPVTLWPGVVAPDPIYQPLRSGRI